MAKGYSDVPTRRSSEKDAFIEEMLPYVKYLAHRIATGLPPSVDINDIVNYGVIGLLDAMKKYDPQRGVKFKTYAETRIRGAILDGMRAADWVPRSVRKARRELEAAYRQAEQDHGRSARDAEVGKYMNMRLDDFRELIYDVQGVSLGSLEEVQQVLDDGAIKFYGHEAGEASDTYSLIEREQLRSLVADAVSKLPERERVICSLYYYDELTMKEIGLALGISESRVSQLHTKATVTVKASLEAKLDVKEMSYGGGNSHKKAVEVHLEPQISGTSLNIVVSNDSIDEVKPPMLQTAKSLPKTIPIRKRKKPRKITGDNIRGIIELREDDGLTYREIGGVMGIPASRVRKIYERNSM